MTCAGWHYRFCESFLHREPEGIPMFELNTQNIEVEETFAEPMAARDEPP